MLSTALVVISVTSAMASNTSNDSTTSTDSYAAKEAKLAAMLNIDESEYPLDAQGQAKLIIPRAID